MIELVRFHFWLSFYSLPCRTKHLAELQLLSTSKGGSSPCVNHSVLWILRRTFPPFLTEPILTLCLVFYCYQHHHNYNGYYFKFERKNIGVCWDWPLVLELYNEAKRSDWPMDCKKQCPPRGLNPGLWYDCRVRMHWATGETWNRWEHTGVEFQSAPSRNTLELSSREFPFYSNIDENWRDDECGNIWEHTPVRFQCVDSWNKAEKWCSNRNFFQHSARSDRMWEHARELLEKSGNTLEHFHRDKFRWWEAE